MKYTVSIGRSSHAVEIRDEEGVRTVCFDGKSMRIEGTLKRGHETGSILIDNIPYEASCKSNSRTMEVHIGRSRFDVHVERGEQRGGGEQVASRSKDEETINAPMPGMVVIVKVREDQIVQRGEPLLILEAMKMENQLRSPVDGRILKVCVQEGRKVEKGEPLIIIGL